MGRPMTFEVEVDELASSTRQLDFHVAVRSDHGAERQGWRCPSLRGPTHYATSRTRITPSESSLKLKLNPVVVIGVGLRNVGGDNSASRHRLHRAAEGGDVPNLAQTAF